MPNMAGEQVTDDAVSVEVYAERHVTTSHAHEEMTFAVSAMLVSAVCFVMGLFYMVNFPDEDIQYYTYHTVGLAISLFSALLIFAALKSAISHKFLEGDLTILASLLHALFWLCAMQVGAAYFSGAVFWSSPKSPLELNPDRSDDGRSLHEWRKRRRDVKCWVGILSHLSALGMMDLLGRVQQTAWFAQSPETALLIVPIGFVSNMALFRSVDLVRRFISMADDEITFAEEMWNEASMRGENEVVSLALSFLTLQAVQFKIVGQMPNVRGAFPVVLARKCGAPEIAWLLGFAGIVTMLILIFASLSHTLGTISVDRWLLILTEYAMMLFAWSCLFAIKIVSWIILPDIPPESIVIHITSALMASLLAFAAVFVVDKVADHVPPEHPLYHMLLHVIMANGFLVGSSWKTSFSIAINQVGKMLGSKGVALNLTLTFLMVLVVLPAYRLYMIPVIANKGQKLAREGRGFSALYEEGSSLCLGGAA